MPHLLGVSSVLGMFCVIESFGLLLIGVRALSHPSLQNFLGMSTPQQLQTMMFLQLVVGGHLLLLVTRTERWFFLPPFPAAKLFFAIVITQIVAVALCWFGWLVPAIPLRLIGLVWLYCLAWMFILGFVRKHLRAHRGRPHDTGSKKRRDGAAAAGAASGDRARPNGVVRRRAWIGAATWSRPARRSASPISTLPTRASTSRMRRRCPKIAEHVARMAKAQYLLYADGSQSLLIVLQALDAGGKDGTIRHLFSRHESARRHGRLLQAADAARA